MTNRLPRIVSTAKQPVTLETRIQRFVKDNPAPAAIEEPKPGKARVPFGRGPSNEEKAARRAKNIVFLRGGR